MGRADYIAPEMAGHFRHNAMFIAGNVREAVNDGRADYTPILLSEVELGIPWGASGGDARCRRAHQRRPRNG